MTSVLFHPLGRPGTSNIRFFSTSCAMVLFLYFGDLRGRKLNYEISQIVFLDTLSGEVCFTAKRRQHEHMDISKKLVNRLTTEKTRSKLPHYRYLSYSYWIKTRIESKVVVVKQWRARRWGSENDSDEEMFIILMWASSDVDGDICRW